MFSDQRSARSEEEISQINNMIKYHMDSDVTVFHERDANRKFVKRMTDALGFRPLVRNLQGGFQYLRFS